MKYFNNKLEKELIVNGFKKITWDNRTKIFAKDLKHEYKYRPWRIMIIPEWQTFIKENEEEQIYRVEIWPEEMESHGNRVFSVKPYLIVKVANLLEEINESFT